MTEHPKPANKAHELAVELGFEYGWDNGVGGRTYRKEVLGEDVYIFISPGNTGVRMYVLGGHVGCEYWFARRRFLKEAGIWLRRIKEHIEFDWRLRMQSELRSNVRTKRVLP